VDVLVVYEQRQVNEEEELKYLQLASFGDDSTPIQNLKLLSAMACFFLGELGLFPSKTLESSAVGGLRATGAFCLGGLRSNSFPSS
jgi:hypothetical protein